MASFKASIKSKSPSKQKGFPGHIVLESKFIKSPPPKKMKNVKSWKERYFVLLKMMDVTDDGNYIQQGRKRTINGTNSSFCLLYWHTEAYRRKGANPIRAISLDRCTVKSHKHPFWEARYPHMIELKTPERIFFLCADTEDQKRLWLDTLKQATELTGGDDEQSQNKTRSGSIDPIYAILNEVLLDRRRPSESTWSVKTDDSGFSEEPRSPSNSSGSSTNHFDSNCHSQTPRRPSQGYPTPQQQCSPPGDISTNFERLSMPHHLSSLHQQPSYNKERSFSEPDIKATFPKSSCDSDSDTDDDEDLYVSMTDEERQQHMNTKFTGFNHQHNIHGESSVESTGENIYANVPQHRRYSDIPVSMKPTPPCKPPRGSSYSVQRLPIGSITLELPNDCTINKRTDGLFIISTPLEEITISVHKKSLESFC